MALAIYMLMAPISIAPAYISFLKSRAIYPTASQISPLGYLIDTLNSAGPKFISTFNPHLRICLLILEREEEIDRYIDI